ncbi:uncharacterized protein LOC110988871 [Acanthaster planci]|uniref:Uncharacterized protein LOC110988871 n=1 Tax=Acanthaster planci TaxID=133434 RepID=A0A8B7ZY44_ACAPL|nr:uncharacterized protein LOC110988871 [Acanthaster planci]XP_022108481.1 uncharacterized protein LOC110988871 [Acanthaster planci]
MRGHLVIILLVMLQRVQPQDKDLMCASYPCLHGGLCQDTLNTYSCNCPPEWTGKNCEQDVDECSSSPCKNMGHCVNREEGFDCDCQQEWTGPTCDRPSQMTECGPQLYTGWPSVQLGSISGPPFTPANFTDTIVPYTCSYTITNQEVTGKVQLIFDDFLMFGSRRKFPCSWIYSKNVIEIYEGQSSTPILNQCFASNKRPSAIVSSGNSLRIDFKHQQSISYQFPVFRAHYRFLGSKEPAVKPRVETITFFEDRISQFSTTLWRPDSHDILWLFVAPKKKHVYLSLNPIYISKNVGIILDVHDGITSYAPKVESIHRSYHFPAIQITSTSNGLYVRCHTGQLLHQNITVAGVFAFYSDAATRESCSEFLCANNRCIPNYFECDGVNHCGDDSDEKPCLGLCPDKWCANGGQCHQVTTGYPRCTCKPHFSGDRCLEEEVCPKDYCMNGGICLGHSVSTRYCLCQRPYSGLRCEQDNSGCPQYYCQNGGSCVGTHDRYHCKCSPEYTGMYCEMKIVETYEEDGFHNSLTYTLITVIPASLLLVSIWVCCRMRRCRNPLYTRQYPEMFGQRSRDGSSVSTDHPSSVSRSLSRMSAGSMYSDEPPPYNIVVRNQRRKLRRHHTVPGPTHTCSEQPPPSYESIVIAQMDPPPYIHVLQCSHARGPRRSLDLPQTVIELQETTSPLLDGVLTGATGGDGSGEQGQGSSAGQAGLSREGASDTGSLVEQNSLLSSGEPSSSCDVSHSL